jgi:hypothetical protein
LLVGGAGGTEGREDDGAPDDAASAGEEDGMGEDEELPDDSSAGASQVRVSSRGLAAALSCCILASSHSRVMSASSPRRCFAARC